MQYNGTTWQLLNALREVGARGGQAGAIADAAAEEIERLKGAAADVWDAVAVLAEAGTPPEGFASIARQNAAYLRSADKGE